MARAAVIFAACIATVHAAARQVNWYLNAGDIDGNAAFITAHADSITGAYLCCNLASVSAAGIAKMNTTAIREQADAVRAAGAASVLAVMSIAEASVHSGSWSSGGAPAALAVAATAAHIDGWISDYEPADNYTIAHAEALGILDFWSAYDDIGLDIATSMTPTYKGSNVTADEDFVTSTLAYIPGNVLSIGVGTELADGKKPEWNYNWTSQRLSSFVGFLGTTGVRSVDVWRADIDHYTNATAPWYFDTLAAYLNGTLHA